MYKVFIVDDEPSVRNGLTQIIDWDNLGCIVVGEAEDGIDALEKIPLLQPDIVISDIKMPGMDGINIAKYLSSNFPKIKVILLTGYAEFSYAQAAIKYGVIDFVLKPTFNKDIEKAVGKAIEIITGEIENADRLKALEERTIQDLVIIQEKFLIDVINNIIVDPDIIKQHMDKLSIHFANYYVIVYELEDISNETEKVKYDTMEQSNLLLSVKNFLSLAFKDYTSFSFAVNNTRFCSIISFDNQDKATCLQMLITKCEEILNIVGNFMHFSIVIGISNMHNTPEGMVKGFAEAKKSIMGRFFNDIGISIYTDNPAPMIQNNPSWVTKALDGILQNIQSGNEESAQALVHELLEKQKNEKHSIEQIINTGILLCSLCSKLIGNYNSSLSNLLEGNVNIYKRIFNCTSMEQLGRLLDGVVQSTTVYLNTNDKQKSYIVKKTLEYISENYLRNVSLQSIAGYIHVNSSYLSRVFKKETGDTITEAINKYRLECSKELLLKTNLKTYEVALQSGFEDASYFSIIFKKYTGVSPKEYRNAR